MSEINEAPIVYMYDAESFEFMQVYSPSVELGHTIRFTNYTEVPCELPVKNGYTRIFNQDTQKWEYIEDNRGFPQYNTESRKEESLIDYLGPIREGFTTDTPISDTCIWQNGWIEI